MKTNAARILDGLGIRYQLREYEVDEEDLSAESVARKVGSQPSPPSRAHLRSAPTYRRALSRAPRPNGRGQVVPERAAVRQSDQSKWALATGRIFRPEGLLSAQFTRPIWTPCSRDA